MALVLTCATVGAVIGLVGENLTIRPDQVTASQPNADFEITGMITRDTARAFAEVQKADRVYVNSQGGDGFAALEIADRMIALDSSLVVSGVCMSACAEFLIPAAKKVYALDHPIIAVHGNPLLFEKMFQERGTVQPESCSALARGLEGIYRLRGRKTELAFAQEQALVVVSFESQFNAEKGCFDPVWYFYNSNWMPTSSEYRNQMGLEIDGALCSDDNSCTKARILREDGLGRCKVGPSVVACLK